MLISDLIAAAHPRMVFEAHPSKRWLWASELPRGYCGEAYYRDDPRLPAVLADLILTGWGLETPDQVAAIAAAGTNL